MDALVSTDWLADHAADPGLRILDATWFLPGEGDAAAQFAAAHIAGARFLDLAALVDHDDPRPSMLPPPEQFARHMAALGVGNDDRVVFYDQSPHHTAARAWAMLRSYGRASMILDGGFDEWRAEDRPIETGPTPIPGGSYATPATRSVGIADQADVADALETSATQVVDARSPGRFAGEEPEPRAGVVPGHMPGAKNLHYAALFEPDGRYKRNAAMREAFAAAGVDPTRPMLATCGSGITASVVAFAAHLLGNEARVYDGSWAEWGADPATPKATVPA